jgi:flagella basal body P-ring formation protein FlgA
MRYLLLACLSIFQVGTVSAELVASQLVRAGDILTEQNIELSEGHDASAKQAILGMAAKRTIYPGQAIKLTNVEPASIVKRNQIVTIKYRFNGLEITTSARAMSDASASANVNVLNIQSKQIVSGVVQNEGWVLVQ